MNIVHTTIPTFSSAWWIATVITVGIIWGLLYILKKQPKSALPRIEKWMFAIIIGHELCWQIFYISTDTFYAGQSLPLHLCGLSKMIGAILMVRYSQYAFEFLLLLGLGGALQAFMTPEIVVKYSLFTHIDYYFNHGVIFFTGLYQLVVRDRRILKSAWWTSFLIGLVVLSLIGVFNYFFNGNYIYLCQKPLADNPFLIGPWPYYLLCFLGFGFVNIVLFQFLFTWWGKKMDAQITK